MKGPRYLLLDDCTGWHLGKADNIDIDGCLGGLRLAQLPGSQVPLTDVEGTFGGLALPCSIALDCEDRIHLLDRATQTIRRFDPCQGVFETLSCVGGVGHEPRKFVDAHSIAISCANDLYVADTGNRRIQVFALKDLALRSVWGPIAVQASDNAWECRTVASTVSTLDCTSATPSLLWPEKTWWPTDVLVEPNCRTLVADAENHLIHVFDSAGEWITAWTGADDGFTGIQKPRRLARDHEGRIYVVQTDSAEIVVLDPKGKFVKIVKTGAEAAKGFRPAAIGFDANGHLHIASELEPTITVVCRDGGGRRENRTYAAGPASDLVFDHSGNLILVGPGPVKLSQAPLKAIYASTGVFYTDALDSRIYRCKWHRLLLDATVPLGTRIKIDTLTAESEKTVSDILSLPEERWSTRQHWSRPGSFEWDCLLDAPEGRFLWLRLTLDGEGQETPVIHKATLEFPRNTSRRFLPATFSEDPVGREFLDQFLAISDSIRNQTAHQLSTLYRYFDPMATPADASGATNDFLAWLASWMGLALEQRWPVEKRRKLVANIHQLYALRGTPEGLRQHINLYAGSESRVLEHFRLRRWLSLGESRLGGATELWGHHVVNRLQLDSGDRLDDAQLIDINDPLRDPFHAGAHRFTVFVPAPAAWNGDEKAVLERIVENAKPAHTAGAVQLLRPRFRVGVQAFIGLDTVVGRYPAGAAAGEMKLGYDSVLAEGDCGQPEMRVGSRARIGASTRLT
jgi:phage tail-like protein